MEDFSSFNNGTIIYFDGKYYEEHLYHYEICFNPDLKSDNKIHKIKEIYKNIRDGIIYNYRYLFLFYCNGDIIRYNTKQNKFYASTDFMYSLLKWSTVLGVKQTEDIPIEIKEFIKNETPLIK